MSSVAKIHDRKQEPATVPVRHMDFNFRPEEFDDRMYKDTILASAIFEALSIFLTYGEDLVIDTARYHRQFLTDPVLKQRVTALIGQEAVHSKVHSAFNDTLAEHRYPVPLYRFLASQVFEHIFKKLSNPMQLSMMAGIEHFTAVLAEYMMKHEEVFENAIDEKQRALWMWHMLEESEHKDIAYDVFEELSGDYALRIAGFAVAANVILFWVPLGGSLIPFFRQPTLVFKPSYWKDVARSIKLLAGPDDGVFGSTMKHVLDYLRRDFHPNDHDTSEYLAYYKNKLLHPEHGLLSPFMTREFVPPLRA